MPETQVDPHTGHQMSHVAEKSQPPEVGIEPGPQDLNANTLLRRCKSRLLPQGSRSVLHVYTYPYYKYTDYLSVDSHCYIQANVSLIL